MLYNVTVQVSLTVICLNSDHGQTLLSVKINMGLAFVFSSYFKFQQSKHTVAPGFNIKHYKLMWCL